MSINVIQTGRRGICACLHDCDSCGSCYYCQLLPCDCINPTTGIKIDESICDCRESDCGDCQHHYQSEFVQ